MSRSGIVGQKFGQLTAHAFVETTALKKDVWLCLCDCGKYMTARADRLVSGATSRCRSCANSARIVHGHARHRNGNKQSRTWKSWAAMISRCANPNNKNFARYGGRGITIAERWKTFSNFLADMGEREEHKELDRIDNNGNYEPGNCRWVAHVDNGRNRSCVKLNSEAAKVIRHLRGTVSAIMLAKLHKVSHQTIHNIWTGKTW